MPSRREVWEVWGSSEKPLSENVMGSKPRIQLKLDPGRCFLKRSSEGPGWAGIRRRELGRMLVREVPRVQTERQRPLCEKGEE